MDDQILTSLINFIATIGLVLLLVKGLIFHEHDR